MECSDKAINAWLADILGETAVVFLRNAFSDQSVSLCHIRPIVDV